MGLVQGAAAWSTAAPARTVQVVLLPASAVKENCGDVLFPVGVAAVTTGAFGRVVSST